MEVVNYSAYPEVKSVGASVDSPKYQLALVGLVFITGLICLRVFGPYTGDSARYIMLARNLAAGHGFSASAEPPYYAEVFRAPLYPLFLSILFRLHIGVTGVILIQLALYAVAIIVMTKVSLEVTQNRRAALLLGILLSTYAPCVRWASSITTEFLCTLLVCSMCFLLVRCLRSPSYKMAVLLGVTIVGLFYTRATYFFIAPLILLLCVVRFHRDRALRFALVLGIVTFLPIGAWVMRNAFVVPGGFHPFGVGTGMALYVKKLELLEPDYDKRTKATVENENFQSFFTDTDPALMVKGDQALAKEAMEVIRPRWKDYLINIGWLTAFREWVELYDPRLPATMRWILPVMAMLLSSSAYTGLFFLRSRLQAVLPLAAIAFLIAGVHAIFATEARYTSPVRPILYMLATVGITGILDKSVRLIKSWAGGHGGANREHPPAPAGARVCPESQ